MSGNVVAGGTAAIPVSLPAGLVLTQNALQLPAYSLMPGRVYTIALQVTALDSGLQVGVKRSNKKS